MARTLQMGRRIAAARELIGWSEADLATAAGATADEVAAAEQSTDATALTSRLGAALEKAGIAFLDDTGDGPGVRLVGPLAHAEGLRPDELNASNDK
jgi:transcriptional regulator with XRE-family HTH domain